MEAWVPDKGMACEASAVPSLCAMKFSFQIIYLAWWSGHPRMSADTLGGHATDKKPDMLGR
jgi:hypothetical protein